MIANADNNDGRYNKVHRQTDDGLVISVAIGNDLVPLVFDYLDYLGCHQRNLLSSDFYPHKRLMRGDCGWRRKDDSVDLLFSWDEMRKVVDGVSAGPNDEYVESWHEEANCAKNARLAGLAGHRTTYYRKDREYWTPDKTLAAEAPEDPFAFETTIQYNTCCKNPKPHKITTVKQWNPITCDSGAYKKCGMVQYYDKCDNSNKAKNNLCNKKGQDKYGNDFATDL